VRKWDAACCWQADVIGGPEGTSSWTVRIDNNTADLTVIEVLFPLVRGIQLGNDHADNVLVFPHHAGEDRRSGDYDRFRSLQATLEGRYCARGGRHLLPGDRLLRTRLHGMDGPLRPSP